MSWKEDFLRIEALLEKQPEQAGKLTTGEVRGLKKPMFKDPEHLARTVDFLEKHGHLFPIPHFSLEEVHTWRDAIEEIDELEPKLVDALQILRHGRLLWNNQFWNIVSKVYQYLKVMGEDFPELERDGAFLSDLMRERAKRNEPKQVDGDSS